MNFEKIESEVFRQNDKYQLEKLGFQPTIVVKKQKSFSRSIDAIADELFKKLSKQQPAANKKEQHPPQQAQLQQISFAQTNNVDESLVEFSKQQAVLNASKDTTSDEQIRASVIHLLNPVVGSSEHVANASGNSSGKKRPKGKNTPHTSATKNRRWLPEGEFFVPHRGKRRGQKIDCGGKFRCRLCHQTVTLNSTRSRFNLLRHVISRHSSSKPFKCCNCDYIGTKESVIGHAKREQHRPNEIQDITTDEMREEWNNLVHKCFPQYFLTREQGNQLESVVATEVVPKDELDISLGV